MFTFKIINRLLGDVGLSINTRKLKKRKHIKVAKYEDWVETL